MYVIGVAPNANCQVGLLRAQNEGEPIPCGRVCEIQGLQKDAVYCDGYGEVPCAIQADAIVSTMKETSAYKVRGLWCYLDVIAVLGLACIWEVSKCTEFLAKA